MRLAEPATRQVKIRVGEELHRELEERADRWGAPLSAVIVELLKQALYEQDREGGPVMQELTRVWQAAFLRGLGQGARARDLADQSPDAAVHDVFAYRVGVAAGQDALLAAQPLGEFKPGATAAEVQQFFDTLDFFARAAARGADIKSRDHGGDET
jgi:hypothetical protein